MQDRRGGRATGRLFCVEMIQIAEPPIDRDGRTRHSCIMYDKDNFR